MLNRLRDRIVVQVDGQLKTGRDVVIAALLGAEEFGFATAPLVVSGCIMMRVCHLDTCPVGIATQNPELRKRFSGRPEFVVNFFEYIAEEVRELLAALGFRRLDEVIGHPELLDTTAAVDHWKAQGLDLSPILQGPTGPPDAPRHQVVAQDHGLDRALDRELIETLPTGPRGRAARAPGLPDPQRQPHRRHPARRRGHPPLRRGRPARRHHRHLLHRLGRPELRRLPPPGHHPAPRGRRQRLPRQGPLRRPPRRPAFASWRPRASSPRSRSSPATSSSTAPPPARLFIRGVVGERFGVRNSGATAVVEGVGDHGCEYMTGGRVVVLGPTGRNFGAGMSGGIAYVWDPDGDFGAYVNPEMVDLEVLDADDVSWLADILRRHVEETGSAVAARLLADWASRRRHSSR